MRAYLLSLCIFLAACGGESAPKFTSTEITGADWGQKLDLHDTQGKLRTLGEFKGKAILLFFGYTQCPDICPTTLSDAASTLKLLAEDAAKVQVLFVTLDPARDSAAVLSKYVPAFNPDFVGLTGTADEIAAAAKEFKVFYRQQPGSTPGTYTIDHTAGSYIFDPRGHLRLFVKHGTAPQQLADDLRLLLQGK